MSNLTLEQKCGLIFEHARRLYAAHYAYEQLGGSNAAATEALMSQMRQAAYEISQLGGEVEIGTDALGQL